MVASQPSLSVLHADENLASVFCMLMSLLSVYSRVIISDENLPPHACPALLALTPDQACPALLALTPDLPPSPFPPPLRPHRPIPPHQ